MEKQELGLFWHVYWDITNLATQKKAKGNFCRHLKKKLEVSAFGKKIMKKKYFWDFQF